MSVTGRSGTKSAAAYYGGRHEPNSEIILPCAALFASDSLDVEQTAAILETADLGGTTAHYAYATLIPVLRLLDEEAEFIWVTRARAATVDSMVRKGRYDPRWDDLWPVSMSFWIGVEGGADKMSFPNHGGSG